MKQPDNIKLSNVCKIRIPEGGETTGMVKKNTGRNTSRYYFKLDENYKLIDPRSSMNHKQNKYKENYNKTQHN